MPRAAIAHTPETIARVLDLRAAGKNYSEIAVLVGEALHRVQSILRKAGKLQMTRGRRPRRTPKVETRIERKCLRCNAPFVIDTRVIRLCQPCREFAREAA